ncbi:MAG TPA: aldolase/citrate lyase family protein [Methylovirgula sp.]
MRSLLLVRPDCERTADAALSAGADCLIFDLSGIAAGCVDAPAYEITRAAFDAARERSEPASLHVRIGDLHNGAADACLDSVMALKPDGIVFAAENGAGIQQLSIKLAVREAEFGIDDGVTKILAMVPAAPAAIFHLGSFADASARVAGLIFAREDLEQALGTVSGTTPGAALAAPIASARHLMLFAAKAAKVPAIDAASPIATDEASLHRMCEVARSEGFSGKLAFDKNQVAILNAAWARGS